jgi:hypothetical protein
MDAMPDLNEPAPTRIHAAIWLDDHALLVEA